MICRIGIELTAQTKSQHYLACGNARPAVRDWLVCSTWIDSKYSYCVMVTHTNCMAGNSNFNGKSQYLLEGISEELIVTRLHVYIMYVLKTSWSMDHHEDRPYNGSMVIRMQEKVSVFIEELPCQHEFKCGCYSIY